jgi:UTP--glucose-1-phosphate uridylyltransferase
MKEALDVRDGILGLPLIRNEKNVDPSDPDSPMVIQVETAMGAAVELFPDSRLIEVGRDRFVPVKTTNDLLVLRSDVYDIGRDFVLDQVAAELPYIDLDGDVYKVVAEFDKRFPEGAPSLKKATSLTVDGDVTFGAHVQVVGDVELSTSSAERIPADTVLTADS